MKNSKLTFVFGFILMTSAAFGQDYAFKVMANKGTNEVKSGSEWVAIKTGVSLGPGDELKVSENSYLGLIHKTGKPLEIKQSGSYKVADLAASVSGGASVLNKYTDFILSSNSAEAKKNRLSATGAVHRGFGLDVFLPTLGEKERQFVFGSKATIAWEESNEGPFEVTIESLFGDELMKLETPENQISINLKDPKLASESSFLVQVRSKSDHNVKSDPHMMRNLTGPQLEQITKAYEEIKPQVNGENALQKYLLAGFFEENGLLIDAATAYQEAIKLAPDVPTYKESYEDFLIRNKFKSPK